MPIGFMYSGSITLDENNIGNLCNFAISFKIESLQTKIEEFLRQKLSSDPNSFVPILKLAIRFSELTLKKAVFEYLQAGLEFVSQQENFKQLTASQVNAVLTYIKDAILPIEIIFLIFSWVSCDQVNRHSYLRILMSNNVRLDKITGELCDEIKHMETYFSLSKSLLLSFLESLDESRTVLGPFTEDLQVLRHTDVAPTSDAVVNENTLEHFCPIVFTVLEKNIEQNNVAIEVEKSCEDSCITNPVQNNVTKRDEKESSPRKRKGNPRKLTKNSDSEIIMQKRGM